jgi:hypothetical protein
MVPQGLTVPQVAESLGLFIVACSVVGPFEAPKEKMRLRSPTMHPKDRVRFLFSIQGGSFRFEQHSFSYRGVSDQLSLFQREFLLESVERHIPAEDENKNTLLRQSSLFKPSSIQFLAFRTNL